MTPAEEDTVVEALTSGTFTELRDAGADETIAARMATMMETTLRCRVPARASVVSVVADDVLDPTGGEPGGFITVEVSVPGVAATTLLSPYETADQRAGLATPGGTLPVRVAARDPGRVALDLFTES